MGGKPKNGATKPHWQISVEQYRALAKQLEERASALFTSGCRLGDAEEAIRIRKQARVLATKATQIETFYLYGEVVTLPGDKR
jgi:hypothetical protein